MHVFITGAVGRTGRCFGVALVASSDKTRAQLGGPDRADLRKDATGVSAHGAGLCGTEVA